MKAVETPKRKIQKQQDYQRHKLLRKIKRRNKLKQEAELNVATNALKRRLKLPAKQ